MLALPRPPPSPIPPSPLPQPPPQRHSRRPPPFPRQTTPISLSQIIISKRAANGEAPAPEYFNGDFTFLANFSNPNRKLDIRFEYLDLELFFSDRLIATQSLAPFTQRPGEGRVGSVRLISSLVYLPVNHAVALQTQVQNNQVNYNMRGTFKVRASLGMIHFSYWLHSRCQLQMTGPPRGVLVARSCKSKR